MFCLFVCCHNYIVVCLLYRGGSQKQYLQSLFFYYFGFKRGEEYGKKVGISSFAFRMLCLCVCVCVIEKVHIKGCERVNLSKQHLVRSICLSLPLLSYIVCNSVCLFSSCSHCFGGEFSCYFVILFEFILSSSLNKFFLYFLKFTSALVKSFLCMCECGCLSPSVCITYLILLV